RYFHVTGVQTCALPILKTLLILVSWVLDNLTATQVNFGLRNGKNFIHSIPKSFTFGSIVFGSIRSQHLACAALAHQFIETLIFLSKLNALLLPNSSS